MLHKAELHVHLEGAVEAETLLEIDPSLTRVEIAAETTYSDFAGFLKSFVWVNKKLKTPEDYARVARHLFARLESQAVTQVEVTVSAGVVLWKQQPFAPVYDALVREAARSPCACAGFWMPSASSARRRRHLCSSWRQNV